MAEITGLRAKFYRETSQGVFEEITQVANITPPQPEREVVDVEELAPEGDVLKKLPGAIDAGQVTVTLNFDSKNNKHILLHQDFRQGSINRYRIKFQDGFGWTFSAFCSAFQMQDIESGSVIQVQVTLVLVGNYDFDEIEDGE